MHLICNGGSRGQIQPWPPIEVGNGVWPPFGAERAMVALWFCRKVKILTPLSMTATDLAPHPYGKMAHHKTWKGRWPKKGHQEFWEIDDIFWAKSRNFFGKRLKKVVQKFRQKFGPPVSVVLNPLVLIWTNWLRKWQIGWHNNSLSYIGTPISYFYDILKYW